LFTFADVIKGLEMGDYPGLSRWAQFKRVTIKKEGNSCEIKRY
jgi:hypothetical protein